MADYYDPSSQYGERSRISQEQVQREPHLLSLKVLRASRPSFKQSKDVYRDETSTESSASTSGFTLTPLLALPTAFGNINLGETFQGLIVAANDSPQDIFDASLRIEIQTANLRTTLWESPPPEKDNPRILKPGDALEAPLLQYEIREPGLHALSCSLSYWSKPRNLSFIPQAGAGGLHMRNFKKLYKFQATNPLSVKTKVHTSRNVAAQLDEETERTVFLEVQIQNTSTEPLFLEHLRLEAPEHQEVEDVTSRPEGRIQPGDLLQCLFIVKASSNHFREMLDKAKFNGGIMPLGKLDIRWRGKMGDPGHLATSQLVRRLPQHMLPPAPSPHPSMQNLRAALAPHQTPEKAPQISRDNSPFHSPRLGAPGVSPAMSSRSQMDDRHFHIRSSDLTVSLYVLPFEKPFVEVGTPFEVRCRLILVSLAKSASQAERRLRLAVQHVDYHAPTQGKPQGTTVSLRTSLDTTRLHHDATPSQSTRTSLETERPLPTILLTDTRNGDDDPVFSLPPPRPLPPHHPFPHLLPQGSTGGALPDIECTYYGNTLLELEPIVLHHQTTSKSELPELPAKGDSVAFNNSEALVRASLESTSTTDEMPLEKMMLAKSAKRTQSMEKYFTLQYLAHKAGIFKLGGIRVLLLSDEWFADEDNDQVRLGMQPCTLVEHNVVAEIRAVWP